MLNKNYVFVIAIMVVGGLAGLFMVSNTNLAPGECISYESIVKGIVQKTERCREPTIQYDDEKVVALQSDVDTLTKDLIEMIEKSEQSQSKKDAVVELALDDANQLKTDIFLAKPSEISSFEEKIKSLEKQLIDYQEPTPDPEPTPIQQIDLDYFYGEWTVSGFYEEGFDVIQYQGTMNFDPNKTFQEFNLVGDVMFGQGTYSYSDQLSPKLTLKKERMDFNFFAVEEITNNSFKLTLPFDRADLSFNKK